MGGASAPTLFFQAAATGCESVGAQAPPTKAWREFVARSANAKKLRPLSGP
ncbi:DUF6053 domain-containing protein [Lysobacter enzymogenes]|uniref:DUF6053 domain-containing protein n=1 Tax=Lysobacter enzymogenes TaxID=69 RepID=UPI003D18ED4E